MFSVLVPESLATSIDLPLGLEVNKEVIRESAKLPAIPLIKLGIPSKPLNKLVKPPPLPPEPKLLKKLLTLVPRVSKEKPPVKPPPAAKPPTNARPTAAN